MKNSMNLFGNILKHIGSKRFYDELKDKFPARGAIILSEGVTDNKNLLKVRSHYEGTASSLGLTTQPAKLSETVASRNADLDLSETSSETMEALNLILGFHATLDKSRSPLELIPKFIEIDKKITEKFSKDPERLFRVLEDDLVMKRNSHLFGEIMASLGEYDVIIVPWGAWHMPGLERLLVARGFKCKETSYSSLF